jgi:two-component system, cell cycle sensor histidine kinase and response regulator CckA
MKRAPSARPAAPPSAPADSAAGRLRQLAEKRLRARKAKAAAGGAPSHRLIHELQVHQVELEMQNEELERARHGLEEAVSKYSELYDFAPVGYLTLDREGGINEANLAAATLLGRERISLPGRPLATFLEAADRSVWAGFLERIFATVTRQSCEVSLRATDRLPVKVRIEAERVASSGQCRVVMIDITEQQRAEADRLILSKLESTGLLASGIAHDFNNLLTVILLNLDEAKSGGGGPAIPPAGLEEARQAALAARGLTQQLITFAKGGAPARKQSELPRVIRDAVRLALSGSSVRADLSFATDLLPAEIDEGQFGQVIRNIVLNGRQAMPKGGVLTVRAENVVLDAESSRGGPRSPCIRVTITDEGTGISPEVLPRIFDPYFSLKSRGTDKGMGLGLTICHSIMHKHGGAISVQSAVGVGSSFQLLLPACARRERDGAATASPLDPKGRRILVMDDDPAVRDVLELILRRLGHDPVVTEDGDQAIAFYLEARKAGRPFELLLLDLTVRAGLGGHAALQALHAVDPEIRAIAMSGYTEDAVVLDPARHGFKAALTKPFESEQARQVISFVMSGARSTPSP